MVFHYFHHPFWVVYTPYFWVDTHVTCFLHDSRNNSPKTSRDLILSEKKKKGLQGFFPSKISLADNPPGPRIPVANKGLFIGIPDPKNGYNNPGGDWHPVRGPLKKYILKYTGWNPSVSFGSLRCTKKHPERRKPDSSHSLITRHPKHPHASNLSVHILTHVFFPPGCCFSFEKKGG